MRMRHWFAVVIACTVIALPSSLLAAGIPGLNFTAVVKNRSDNQPVPKITWASVSAGVSGWIIADQYVEITSVMTIPNGFLRTYTDNTSPTASPRFTGPSGATAAGLVNRTNTTFRIPVAWCVRDDVTWGPQPAGDPNTTFFGWFYYEDASQPNFNSNTALMDYAIVQGPGTPDPWVHYGAWPPWGNVGAPFGPAVSPNYMWFEADFTGGVAGTYETNSLFIEAYTI